MPSTSHISPGHWAHASCSRARSAKNCAPRRSRWMFRSSRDAAAPSRSRACHSLPAASSAGWQNCCGSGRISFISITALTVRRWHWPHTCSEFRSCRAPRNTIRRVARIAGSTHSSRTGNHTPVRCWRRHSPIACTSPETCSGPNVSPGRPCPRNPCHPARRARDSCSSASWSNAKVSVS